MNNPIKNELAEHIAQVFAEHLSAGELTELGLEGFKRVEWEIIVMRAQEIKEEHKEESE